MAAPPPSAPTTPGPSPTKRRHRPDASSTSLRNSCEACAASKIKCSGRKPACHRCEKRGFPCEYIHAKRAGRKPANAAGGGRGGGGGGDGSGGAPQPQRPGNANEVESSRDKTVASVASETAFVSPGPDIWGDLNSLDHSLFSELSNINGASTGFTPPFSLEAPAFDAPAPTAPMMSTSNLYTSGAEGDFDWGLEMMSDAGQQGSSDAMGDLFAFSLPTPAATSLITPNTSGCQSVQRSPSKAQPCSCLTKALGLIRRLSELACSIQASWAVRRDADAVRTIQDILQQNKGGIDGAIAILECQGRHDGYLLIVVSLAAFKSIELLRAVLPETPTPSGSQSSKGNMWSMVASSDSNAIGVDMRGLEAEDWARLSTQALLSDLHDVRRLIKMLSEKLRVQAVATASMSVETFSTSLVSLDGQEERSNSSNDTPTSESEVRLPFSGGVYRQLEVDLDNRLKWTSQQMIQRLRTF